MDHRFQLPDGSLLDELANFESTPSRRTRRNAHNVVETTEGRLISSQISRYCGTTLQVFSVSNRYFCI